MILDSNILIGVLAVCVLCLTADIFHLRWSLRRMLRSKDGKGCVVDLGQNLAVINADIKDLEKFRSDMEEYLKGIEKRIRRSTQATETIRFNAFKDSGVGGNQSFATAFLNEQGDGTVLSSLYTRERVSVYSKPIAKFASEYDLSEEEQRAVALAKSKLTNRA